MISKLDGLTEARLDWLRDNSVDISVNDAREIQVGHFEKDDNFVSFDNIEYDIDEAQSVIFSKQTDESFVIIRIIP